jgi:DNA-binding beta-propeller fold protein YncE
VLVLPASAAASYQFDLAWGSQGSAEGQFGTATGLAVDPNDGSVYVADDFRQRIQKFQPDGDFVAAWGWGVDTGASAYEICTSGCQAGIAGSGDGQFSAPDGLATDSSGNVYVADINNHRIQKFGPDGDFLDKWGTSGAGEGQLNNPHGVGTDGSGNVYVADTFNHRIQAFDSNGDFVRMWGWGVDDGTAALQVCTVGCQAGTGGSGQGQLSYPENVAGTAAGDRVYVSDSFNYRMQAFTPTGGFLNAWGGTGGDEGQFLFNDGIGLDPAGSLLVADPNNQRIQRFTATGGFLGTFGWGVSDGSSAFQVCASGCQAGLMGSGAGQFHSPNGVGVDSAGNVYVADRSNARVQRFAAIAPQTIIDSAPEEVTGDDTPSFGFRSTLPDSTFECSVDAAPFAPCNDSNQTSGGETTGGFTSDPLGDGEHSVEVRALDHVAIPDPTAAEAEFAVDTQAPGVANLKVDVNSKRRRAEVTFTVTDPAPGSGVNPECRLDSGAFAACASGKRYRHLDVGRHKVRVRATDEAGNLSAVAEKRFKVKR